MRKWERDYEKLDERIEELKAKLGSKHHTAKEDWEEYKKLIVIKGNQSKVKNILELRDKLENECKEIQAELDRRDQLKNVKEEMKKLQADYDKIYKGLKDKSLSSEERTKLETKLQENKVAMGANQDEYRRIQGVFSNNSKGAFENETTEALKDKLSQAKMKRGMCNLACSRLMQGLNWDEVVVSLQQFGRKYTATKEQAKKINMNARAATEAHVEESTKEEKADEPSEEEKTPELSEEEKAAEPSEEEKTPELSEEEKAAEPSEEEKTPELSEEEKVAEPSEDLPVPVEEKVSIFSKVKSFLKEKVVDRIVSIFKRELNEEEKAVETSEEEKAVETSEEEKAVETSEEEKAVETPEEEKTVETSEEEKAVETPEEEKTVETSEEEKATEPSEGKETVEPSKRDSFIAYLKEVGDKGLSGIEAERKEAAREKLARNRAEAIKRDATGYPPRQKSDDGR